MVPPPTLEPLSPREAAIYEYLVSYLAANTYQPTVREIGRHVGIASTKTVSDTLTVIARKGWIERADHRSRGVRILALANRHAGTPSAERPTRARRRPTPAEQALRAILADVRGRD